MERINYLALTRGAEEWRADLYDPDTYLDPDEVCKQLYVDLRLAFLEFARTSDLPEFKTLKLLKPRRPGGSWEFEEESPVGGVRYSSDFIGPSRAWASWAQLSQLEIGDYLGWARELGGHIIWPKHECSISQARGGGLFHGEDGSARGNQSGVIYDRLDLTLLELQDYMRNPLNDPTQRVSKEQLRRAFMSEAAWFERFKPHPDCTPEEWFSSFVSFWKLESFINNDGDPMSMVDNEPHEVLNRQGKAVSTSEVVRTPDEEQKFFCDYKKYVANMEIAIRKRTNIMVEILAQAN